MMESLARALGDFKGLIAVKSADLSTPYAYLDIAETCHAAGMGDGAIQWAEEGISTFPEAQDARLHDFLADRYEEAGRALDAIALAWTAAVATKRATT